MAIELNELWILESISSPAGDLFRSAIGKGMLAGQQRRGQAALSILTVILKRSEIYLLARSSYYI